MKKKVLLTMLTVAMVTGLTACGSEPVDLQHIESTTIQSNESFGVEENDVDADTDSVENVDADAVTEDGSDEEWDFRDVMLEGPVTASVTVEAGDEMILRDEDYTVTLLNSYDNQVLIDEQGVKIEFKGISTNALRDICWDVTIENNTDAEIKVDVPNGILDGYMAEAGIMNPKWSSQVYVGPGETLDAFINFSGYDTEDKRMTEIAQMIATIEVSNESDTFIRKRVELVPTTNETTEDALEGVGQEIYNDGNIRIEYIGIGRDYDTSDDGVAILLLENLMGEDIEVYTMDYLINRTYYGKVFEGEVVAGTKMVALPLMRQDENSPEMEEMVLDIKVVENSGEVYETGNIVVTFN